MLIAKNRLHRLVMLNAKNSLHRLVMLIAKNRLHRLAQKKGASVLMWGALQKLEPRHSLENHFYSSYAPVGTWLYL